MRPRFLLALDQGTTSSRAIVFDVDGRVRASAQRELPQHFPSPGCVEHDPLAIWSTQLGAALEALAHARLQSADIAALGITNQRETTIVWDRETGAPIHHAIVWQDRRTAAFCERLKRDGVETLVKTKTGLPIDPYFSASKARWILDHVPGARAQAEAGRLAFGTVDTWLIWQLTSGRRHVTDVSNASRTMLFDIRTLSWDPELLEIFGLPAALLPEVVESSGVVAHADVPGLTGIPIAGIAGDQQAALFGQLCHSPGMAKNTYGTGCFLLQHVGDVPAASVDKLVTTVAWTLDGRVSYAMEGSVFIGGAVVQWLRDGLGLIAASADVEALAASVPDSGGVFLVPAFAGLGAPHWDPFARGLIVGLTRGTTAAHIARAAVESMAFQVADLLTAMRDESGVTLGELRVDGGAAVNDALLQFQADLMGVPVVRPAVTETTALGAAYLAGLGVGAWESPASLGRQWRVDRRFEPSLGTDEVAIRRHRWASAVARAGGWEAV